MKTETYRKVLAVREAARVKRCHTFPTIKEHTVGEHTYGATALLLLLCPHPSVTMIQALTFHDFAERFIGDLPAQAKAGNIDLENIYEEIEDDIMRAWGFKFALTDFEIQWIKAVDMLDFYFYSKEESLMGNGYAIQRLLRIGEYIRAKYLSDEFPKEAYDVFLEAEKNTHPFVDDMEAFCVS